MLSKLLNIIVCCVIVSVAPGQSASDSLWHGKERVLEYRLVHPHAFPAGFESVNGHRRFNRALYGTNTGFRVEAGDLPEFALYLPGMGGNFKLGLKMDNETKWLTSAKNIIAGYFAGLMNYRIMDTLQGPVHLLVTIIPCANREGMLLEVAALECAPGLELIWAFGGATGKRFSRDGDIGADPESSFYLQPEYCKGNSYTIDSNRFQLSFGEGKKITGIVPSSSSLKIVDAAQQESPASLYESKPSSTPAIAGLLPVAPGKEHYFLLQPGVSENLDSGDLQYLFRRAYDSVWNNWSRIETNLPDYYLFGLGPALNTAADAIWEHPSYLHGAVAWRMRLPAWRGAYAADPLGWHDRARTHFSSYALSQVTTPETAPVVMDTALHLARHLEKIGTGMFTSGYICRNPNGDIRPHHYDMNLVFIDQLLNHFYWTGDTSYVKEMWPVIERHLAWEKRNFDADGDGLYDAYCCIWASDALQYSGGGVTHSSAYNYRAFKTAAELAALIGKDGTVYKKESEKILKAVNKELWMPQLGWYAEYKDLLGKKLVHTVPGIWTIYHALDAKLPDAFQAYQSTRYIDTQIPHIPVRAKGLGDDSLYLLSTSNWQPYTWSINNVALAENLHAALAYWQANRPDEATRLWKSALVESMWLGASPGGFQQLSFYDAVRGQLYRDFADPIGMAARTLVEGLFGIQPDALHDTIFIKPGFPAKWEYAGLKLPDIQIQFYRKRNADVYFVKQYFPKQMNFKLQLPVVKTGIESIRANGQPVKWMSVDSLVGKPALQISMPKREVYNIEIRWKGAAPAEILSDTVYTTGEKIYLSPGAANILSIHDPQNVFISKTISGKQLSAVVGNSTGNKTVFVQLTQGAFSWWQPVNFKVVKPIEITSSGNSVIVRNNSKDILGQMWINKHALDVKLGRRNAENAFTIKPLMLIPGTNTVSLKTANHLATGQLLNWEVSAKPGTKFEKIDLTAFYNEKVTNIFKQNYLSPRPTSPTLQLPIQGIGNWCYPLTTAEISDSGLRKQAGSKNEIILPQGIPFATPGDSNLNNIVFTSQWDNFPDSVIIPLSGSASHAYMMMAGSTNPMQSRMVNGEVRIRYKDGSADTLLLKNPVNWWPIEQDYMNDGYAFTTDGYIPLRYYLKKGIAATTYNEYISIRGFSNRGIDGGAATVLDLPLRGEKELESVVIHTLANDVVIGLMSLTLVR